MISINSQTYEGEIVTSANYRGDLSATFNSIPSESEILEIIAQKEIRELNDRGELIGVYALVKWRAVERIGTKLRIIWQTFVHDEVQTANQDIDDLTQAVLELAAMIGGGNG